MKNPIKQGNEILLVNTNHNDRIRQELEHIREFLNDELSGKNLLLEKKDLEIEDLRLQLKKREEAGKTLQMKLSQVELQSEGNRQLINKLLGDIAKMQNDIDWYKRTYEQRSFMGTIKEKLVRKFLK